MLFLRYSNNNVKLILIANDLYKSYQFYYYRMLVLWKIINTLRILDKSRAIITAAIRILVFSRIY